MAADDSTRLAARNAAARRLQVDHAAGEAITALERAGIPCILLKGASVARWLFSPEEARTYSDCDLLVEPSKLHSAVAVLTGLGYEAELDESAMPSWWREHALTAQRAADGAIIDVHRSIQGVQVSDDHAWTTLSQITDTLALGTVRAQVLPLHGRALHAALHAAQHAGAPRDLEVLSRAVGQLADETWRRAALLAEDLQATAALQRGLGFLPEGRDLVERLGLAEDAALAVELRAIRAREALTLSRLIDTPGVGRRASIVIRKLFPPATFMRKWSPLARRGGLGLIAAYCWRPLWVASRLPSALRALRSARER